MMENNKKRKVADIDKSVDTIYSTTNTSDSKGQSYNTATTTPGNNNASNNSSIFNTPGSSNITRYNLLRDYFSRHPCLKPYEEEDGVGLAFNYWQDSYYLVDEHILEVIDFLTTPTVSGTKSSDPQSFSAAANVKSQNGIDFLRKDSLKSIEDGCDNVLIVGIHSVDPLDLAESINTMPFLSSCSSMPIRHLKKESLRFSSNSNLYQWPYMDMQTINSTLLWQDKKTLTLSQIPKTALHEFFSNYIIIYKGIHSNWTHDLKFYQDSSATKQSFEQLLQSKVASDKPSSKHYYEEIVNNWTDTDVFGKFGKVVGDTGFYLLRRNAENGASIGCIYRLFLLWSRWDIEVLESVSSESELSFSMVKRDESTAEFRLASMQLLPMLMNCSGDSCSRSLAVQTLAVDEDEILYPTKNFSKEDILTLKATYCMLVEKDVLRKLILSNDIRDMIGFSSEWKKDGPAADLQQERFFELYTSDPDWFISSKDHVKVDSSSEGGKARTIAVGVKDNTIEDGEEEDGDEEHTMETQVSSHIHFEESSNNDMNVDFPTKLSMTFNEVPFPLTISALDCEMCATEAGLELTRITIVSPIYGLILDTLVKPNRNIVNYLTEFSGITAEMMTTVDVSLFDVQQLLRRIIDKNTIIVGHSLDTDLKVLQLVHSTIIDTCALFCHPKGLPNKNSLKNLAKDELGKKIQDDGVNGHDSVEDSVIALELAFRYAVDNYTNELHSSDRLLKLAKVGVFDLNMKESIFARIQKNLLAATRADKKNSTNGTAFAAIVPCQAELQTWEKTAYAYGEDSSVKLALASYLADPESSLSVSYNECQSNKCAIDIALANISSRQKEQFSIGWVELSGTEEQPIKMKKTSNSFLDTISKFASGTTMDEEAIASPAQQQLRCIDAELKRLFESCPKGTTILVATQGNAREVKQLASRKLRNKWELASKRKGNALAFGSIPCWDNTEDEAKLIAAAAHAIAGSFFIKQK